MILCFDPIFVIQYDWRTKYNRCNIWFIYLQKIQIWFDIVYFEPDNAMYPKNYYQMYKWKIVMDD